MASVFGDLYGPDVNLAARLPGGRSGARRRPWCPKLIRNGGQADLPSSPLPPLRLKGFAGPDDGLPASPGRCFASTKYPRRLPDLMKSWCESQRRRWNFNDVDGARGRYRTVRPPLPYAPGMEVLGYVGRAAGAGAEAWLGKRVAAVPSGAFGGYAELAVGSQCHGLRDAARGRSCPTRRPPRCTCRFTCLGLPCTSGRGVRAGETVLDPRGSWRGRLGRHPAGCRSPAHG